MSDPVSVPPPKRSDAPVAARATKTATGTSPANTAAKAAAEAKPGKCAKHNLQAAPDGLCAICRREQGAAAQLSEPRGIPNAVLGVIAVIAIGAAIAWAVNSPAAEPRSTRSRGPSLAEQILVIDDQLKELRDARQRGELDAMGLNEISRLEMRRAILETQLRAQDD